MPFSLYIWGKNKLYELVQQPATVSRVLTGGHGIKFQFPVESLKPSFLKLKHYLERSKESVKLLLSYGMSGQMKIFLTVSYGKFPQSEGKKSYLKKISNFNIGKPVACLPNYLAKYWRTVDVSSFTTTVCISLNPHYIVTEIFEEFYQVDTS